jgi:hypothetical protein
MLRVSGSDPTGHLRRPAVWTGSAVAIAAAVLLMPATAEAQTDFYNLDHGRPLRVEDAYTTKRWAFELQVSPFSLSQERSGALRFAPSIELKHGLLPGLEVSVALGAENVREGSESSLTFEDVEASALLNLWVEGPRIPAAGIRVTGSVPTTSDRSSALEVRGILTRGLVGPVRGHLNAAAIVGADRPEDWWAGAALDYVLPFRHTLLLAEGWVASVTEGKSRVHSGVGARTQLTPTLLVDAGIGRDWSGDSRADWSITLGVTYEFGVRALLPGADR